MTLRMPPPEKGRDHTGTIVAGVVALVGVVGFTVVALERSQSDNTIVVVGILVTMVTTALTSLLALLRTEQGITRQGEAQQTLDQTQRTVERTEQAVDGVVHVVNGELDRRMAEIAERVIEERAAK